MATYYKSGKTWCVSYRLKGHDREYVYGLKTERVAKQVKAAKDLEEQLVKAGIHKPQPNAAKIEAAERKDVADHVDAFEKSILDRGKNEQHAAQTASHVRRLFKMAGVNRISQIEAEPLQAAAKRLLDEAGLAPRTVNAAVKAALQFSTWLLTSKRTPVDLLHRKLHTYNEAVDQRRRRRALSIEEFHLLLDAAHAGKRRCNIPGRDRAMLYQVAVGTGFRQRACLSLTKASFHVAPKLDAPYVTLGAEWNKNGKSRDQKIRRDLADLLHAWLKDKADTGRLWQPSEHAHLELMVRRDLEAARAAWLKAAADEKERAAREKTSFLRYEDHAGRFADFHGLRHTGISLVVRNAGLKVAQDWADHSTPVLTAKYAHLDMSDEQRALEGLPGAHAPGPARSPKSTGTVRKNSETRKIG